MATNQSKSGIKSDPGTEINPLRSLMPVDGKSFIVGKYDEQGFKKAAGKGADVGEMSHATKLMHQSMRTRGGEVMKGFIMTPDGPVKASAFTPKPQQFTPKANIVQVAPPKSKKGKKGAKAKEEPQQSYLQTVSESINVAESTYELPQEEVKAETFAVVFNIESGTIKSNADAILEDELGLILVYANADSISYVPKRGGKLSITLPGKRKLNVMYLGIQMQWYNSNQQILLFVKTDKE